MFSGLTSTAEPLHRCNQASSPAGGRQCRKTISAGVGNASSVPCLHVHRVRQKKETQSCLEWQSQGTLCGMALNGLQP